MLNHLILVSSVVSSLVACSTSRVSASPTPSAPPAVASPSTEVVIELAAQRAKLLGWLHDYREAGVFPSVLGMPASVFVDPTGVRCPMAELLHKSGRDDLVEAVAREANTVRLADVHTGPLHAWMLGSGLTQEEIALVQGAMNISFDWMPEQPQQGAQQLAAKAAVRAKLEIAELALRDNTGASLATAAKRLPRAEHPEALTLVPVHGEVVPKAAVPRVALEAVIVPSARLVRRFR